MARVNDMIYFLWTILTVHINIVIALTGRSGCSDVKFAYGSVEGINPNDVPSQAVPGES